MRKQSGLSQICHCYWTNMPRFYISAFFQKYSEMIKLPWQKKLGLELKSPVKEKTDITISLSKLKIFITVLSKRLKEFVGKTFYKGKIQLRKPGGQMIKIGIRRLFNIPDPSNSK